MHKTGQCYPNRTYSRKRPKYKSDKNKRGGALSKTQYPIAFNRKNATSNSL